MRDHFQYRSPSLSDSQALAELGRDTFIETFGHLYQTEDLESFLSQKYTREIIERQLADPSIRHQVVEEDGELIAFIKIGPLDLPVSSPPSKASEIKQLYVRKSFGGMGIGRGLMSWAFEQMEANGIENIYLSVFSENHRAIRFYQRFGFTKCGDYHYPVGKHLDLEWIMQLPLSSIEL